MTLPVADQPTNGGLWPYYLRWLECKKREEQEKLLEEMAQQRAVEVSQKARDSSRRAVREETQALLQEVADTRMRVNKTMQRVLKAQFEARVTAEINKQIALDDEEEEAVLNFIAQMCS